MRVARNFWIESNENCHYLAIWMLFEIITMQLPKVCFELPNIQKILEQCKNNKSRYSFWAQGKFHQIVKINRNERVFIFEISISYQLLSE